MMAEEAEKVERRSREATEEETELDNEELLGAVREMVNETNATPATNYQAIRNLDRRLARIEAALSEERE